MTDDLTNYVAHIDGANRLYFVRKEEPATTENSVQNCQYYQSDSCDCHGECMYGKGESKP